MSSRKQMPGNMAGTAAQPTQANELSNNEKAARRAARSRVLSAFRLVPHCLQPAERHATSNVLELKESIRQLGLLEPPLVWLRSESEHVILAGHRRCHAWRLLVAEGHVKPEMRVYVLEGIEEDEALKLIAAEYFHRREYSVIHTAQLVGEAHRAVKAARQGDVPLRELEAVLPLGRTSLGHYLTIHQALQDPRLAPLVHSADKASKVLLYKALTLASFSAKRDALDVLQPKSTTHVCANAGNNAVVRGRPSKNVVRNQRGKGFDLVVKVRVRMAAEDVHLAREALERALRELGTLHPHNDTDGSA